MSEVATPLPADERFGKKIFMCRYGDRLTLYLEYKRHHTHHSLSFHCAKTEKHWVTMTA